MEGYTVLRSIPGLGRTAFIADLAKAFSTEVSTVIKAAEQRHRHSGKR